MKMRIAIITACAGTLALAQSNLAQAAYPGATEPTMPVTDVGPEPVIVLAQSSLVNSSHSNIRHPGRVALPKTTTDKGKQLPIADQAAGGVLSKKKN